MEARNKKGPVINHALLSGDDGIFGMYFSDIPYFFLSIHYVLIVENLENEKRYQEHTLFRDSILMLLFIFVLISCIYKICFTVSVNINLQT